MKEIQLQTASLPDPIKVHYEVGQNDTLIVQFHGALNRNRRTVPY